MRYDFITEVQKRYDEIEDVQKYNHNHDALGRFSSGNGGIAGSGSLASASGGYFDCKDTGTFTDAVAKAQSKVDPSKSWRVSAPSKEDFEAEHPGAKMHITKNGSTVAVAQNGDIVSLCGNPPDHGMDLFELAVANGGTKGDSFSGLYGFYRKAGMEPRTVCEFDERYAPPGWVKGRDDPEPVIFWEYTGNKSTKSGLELAREKDEWLASQKMYAGDNGYGDAMAERDKMMKGGKKK